MWDEQDRRSITDSQTSTANGDGYAEPLETSGEAYKAASTALTVAPSAAERPQALAVDDVLEEE